VYRLKIDRDTHNVKAERKKEMDRLADRYVDG
jgi:hypothetical protein